MSAPSEAARREAVPVARSQSRSLPRYWERAAASLGRILGVTRLEVKLGLGSPALWLVALILGLFGYLVVRLEPDGASYHLGWVLSNQTGPLTIILLLFLVASLAHRPVRYDVSELEDSKTVASEELILGRWLGMVAAALVPLLIQYTVAAIGQKIHAKPAIEPLAYLQSLLRLFPALLFFTTLSFCLVTLTRVLILGGGLAALTWFALYTGQLYYPTSFRIELSQNAPVFLGLTGSTLLFMLLGYRGWRRAKRAPVAKVLACGAALLLGGSLLYGAWATLALPGKERATAAWRRISGFPRLRPPPKGTPLLNFAWTDLRGRRVSVAGLEGRTGLLVFFQPKDGGLVPLLRRLSALQAELGGEGLEIVAVCLSEDLYAARDAARLAGATLPVVTDWGVPRGEEFKPREPGSVAAWALRITNTPTAILLRPDGSEWTRDLPLDEAGLPDLRTKLRAALAGEELEPAAAPSVPDGLLP